MRGWLTTAAVAALLAGAGGAQRRGPAPWSSARREFRGAWVATVNNIDWPSKPGLPVDRQRAELAALLDRAAETGLNAVILQVRTMCDALYASELEPWSEWLTGEQGRAPEPAWDPLHSAVAGAHSRGLELHAWFNPYRARHAVARSKPADNHVSQRMAAAVVEYGAQLWLDPASVRAREHSLAVILDVVSRYDIDGVHIDDYFYPYPENKRPFPDDRSFDRYRRGGGRKSRAAWRRANVDAFVQKLYHAVKERKRWVKVGISPFGIYRPGVPKGIEAGLDQYEDLGADVVKWLEQGWCDYLAPQLYWRITPKAQSYPVLLDWWTSVNPLDRPLWPGNSVSNVKLKPGWSVDEIIEQVGVTRGNPGASGNILYSMQALMGLSRIATALRDGPYRRGALVPAMTWLDDEAPPMPELSAKREDGAVVLRWQRDPDVRWWTVYTRRSGGDWDLRRRLFADRTMLRVSADAQSGIDAIALAAVDAYGNESPADARKLK